PTTSYSASGPAPTLSRARRTSGDAGLVVMERSEQAGGERRHPFGAQLRRLRLRANLTQEALAVPPGLSPDPASLLERGLRRTPRRSTLVLLTGALRLTPEERELFIARAEHEEPSPPEGSAPAPRELPRPAADFVGRAAELAALGSVLGATGRTSGPV